MISKLIVIIIIEILIWRRGYDKDDACASDSDDSYADGEDEVTGMMTMMAMVMAMAMLIVLVGCP